MHARAAPCADSIAFVCQDAVPLQFCNDVLAFGLNVSTRCSVGGITITGDQRVEYSLMASVGLWTCRRGRFVDAPR